MSPQFSDWEAWYDKMPAGQDPNLHVAGNAKLESGSIEVELVPGNPGTPGEPEVFVLDLKVTTPSSGTSDFVEEPVSWSEDVGPDIKWVVIRGAVDERLEVKDVV